MEGKSGYPMRKLRSKSAPVGVISKVLRILELLDHSPYGLQLKDIAAKTGINKSTAYRFLRHLEEEGYLFRDAAGTYMPGARLATGETVNLAVLDGTEIVYLDVLESQQMFRLVSPVGMRRPAHLTSLGKAIIANLDDKRRKEEILSSIRTVSYASQKTNHAARLEKALRLTSRQGFSLDDEESATGARCVGAAIFDAEESVVGGISVSGPVLRITKKRLPFFSTEVRKAAREISWQLGLRTSQEERAADSSSHPHKT
jgi:DNA-binding IclR family transcriptional regulator